VKSAISNASIIIIIMSIDYKHTLLPVTYSLVFLLGLTLNGAVLCLSWRLTRKWSCSTIYLVNLAVADLLYVCSLPLLILNYIWRDRWPFGDFLCRLVRFLFYANLYGSILFLTCISVHRYLGLCFPMKSIEWRTRRLAVETCVVAWIMVGLQVVPTYLYAHTGSLANKTVCYDLTSPDNFHNYLPYGTVLTVTGFVIPFVIIILSYCCIIKTLIVSGDSTQLQKPVRTKSIRTIVLVCGLLAVCFVPFHITRTIYLFVRAYLAQDCNILQTVSLAYKIWRPVISFNSCINPLLYFLSGDNYSTRLGLNTFCHSAHKILNF
uniref:G-protein coupled receptors family 1 profile domain-containing protein n=1 Tax=Callorhinchus milii TaxID=7868 RepID=A0A4W3K0M8_CALMI